MTTAIISHILYIMTAISIPSFYLIPFFFIIGVAAGVFLAFVLFDKAARTALRKRIESGKPASRLENWVSSTRDSERRIISGVLVSIKAPVFDAAGIAAIGEEVMFSADLADISASGASAFSQYFVPVDTDIEISCSEKKYAFPYRPAKVRNIVLTQKGLKIGLQFFEKLNIV
ncbi:MAG: hypothetical protein WC592_00150 [Candidatus Omnitrophota bacterium]